MNNDVFYVHLVSLNNDVFYEHVFSMDNNLFYVHVLSLNNYVFMYIGVLSLNVNVLHVPSGTKVERHSKFPLDD